MIEEICPNSGAIMSLTAFGNRLLIWKCKQSKPLLSKFLFIVFFFITAIEILNEKGMDYAL